LATAKNKMPTIKTNVLESGIELKARTKMQTVQERRLAMSRVSIIVNRCLLVASVVGGLVTIVLEGFGACAVPFALALLFQTKVKMVQMNARVATIADQIAAALDGANR